MDFLEFKKLYKRDEDYPERCFDMQMFRRILNGTIYDILPYPFNQCIRNSGNSGESIPLSKRRPSVRYRLCKVVVDQTVSLLFGEGRFPTLTCEDDEKIKEVLDELIAARKLNLVMIDAAIKGSAGSVALFLKIIKGKIFVNAYCTEYLTPKYDPEDPDELSLVTEKCKKKGSELIEMGYVGLDKKETYWWMRQWDSIEERYYIPWKLSDEEKENFRPEIDKERTVIHNLGFVPIVWIINLPGKEDSVDGLCTFEPGIDTNIELDYQLSQGGRGLKYSSEPLLMIKNPSLSMKGDINLSEGNVIEVDENGDAKHIEISGNAIEGVLNFSARLREVALESMHGNRSNPEKLHTVQSGKGAEMFFLPLIWVADKQRTTYGECGFLPLLKMLVKCNQKHDLIYEHSGKMITVPKGSLKIGANLGLQWQDWFAATRSDRLQEAQTLSLLTGGEPLMTQETAIGSLAAEYDIVDIEKEKSDLQKLSEKKAKDAMALASVKKSDKINQE